MSIKNVSCLYFIYLFIRVVIMQFHASYYVENKINTRKIFLKWNRKSQGKEQIFILSCSKYCIYVLIITFSISFAVNFWICFLKSVRANNSSVHVNLSIALELDRNSLKPKNQYFTSFFFFGQTTDLNLFSIWFCGHVLYIQVFQCMG